MWPDNSKPSVLRQAQDEGLHSERALHAMSFLKSLFGGGKTQAEAAPAEAKTTGQVDYKGYVVRAVPFKEQGQYQLAGIIEKEVGGEKKSYRFVRADRSNAVEDVTQMALDKGQKIIDEQGDMIFG